MSGKHLRHARDHFVLLVDSIPGPSESSDAAATSVPAFSYDVRSRNTPMETSRAAAIEALNECIEKLTVIVPRVPLNQPVALNAVTPHPQVFQTTFGREVRAPNGRLS